MSTPRRHQRLLAVYFWIATALAAIVFGVQFYHKATDGLEVDNRASYRSYWTRSYFAVEAFRRGQNIYLRPHDFPQLPIVAIALMPLTLLPHKVATVVYYLLKLGSLAVGVFCGREILRDQGRSPPGWVIAVGLLLTVRWVSSDIQHANINSFYLMTVLAALLLLVRRRPTWAGLVMGLSIVIKVTSGLFLLYFLWKRQWRAALATVLGMVLFAVAVPALVIGPKLTYEGTMSWRENMVRPYQQGYVWTETHNQSLPAVFYHGLQAVGVPFEPIHPTSVLQRPPLPYRLGLKALMLAILLLMAFSCRGKLGSGPPIGAALEFSLVCMGMLIFSERSWKAHYLAMLLVNLTLAAALERYRWRRLKLKPTIAVLAVFYLVALFSGETILGETFSNAVERCGQILWHLLAVFVVFCIMLYEIRRDGLPPPRRTTLHGSTTNRPPA